MNIKLYNKLFRHSLISKYLYKYLIGWYKEGRSRVFLVVSSDRTRCNKHKQKYNKFCLNIRKYFYSVKAVKHRNRLPRHVVQAPSAETFNT